MNKLKAVIGVTNRTEDNRYIPFLDYDKIDYVDLIYDVGTIQARFNLSLGFIIKSTNGYNVFFLDKLTFRQCLDICKSSERIDTKFTEYAEKKQNFTLRIGKDKKFIKMFPNVLHSNYELSQAHYTFFSEFFHVDIMNGIQTTDFNFDKYDEVTFVMYMSKKYGYIEVD